MHYLPEVSTALPACWTMQLLNASNSFSVCRTLFFASSRKMTTSTTFCYCLILRYKYYWIHRMNMIGCPLTSVQVVQLLHAEHWRNRLHQNTADLDSNRHSRFWGIWRTLWEHVERWAPCISISVQRQCSGSAVIGLLNAFMRKRWAGQTFCHIRRYIIVCTCLSHIYIVYAITDVDIIHTYHFIHSSSCVCVTRNTSMLCWTWDVISLEDSKSQTQRRQYAFKLKRHI